MYLYEMILLAEQSILFYSSTLPLFLTNKEVDRHYTYFVVIPSLLPNTYIDYSVASKPLFYLVPSASLSRVVLKINVFTNFSIFS